MLYPYATRRSMKQLLAARGFAVGHVTYFSRIHHSTFFRWMTDSIEHTAYFTAAAGQPYLSVDGTEVETTLEELLKYGMVREK